MRTHTLAILLAILPAVVCAQDEKPPEEAPEPREEPEVVKPVKEPRIVVPEKMQKPYESQVPLAEGAREVLELQALSGNLVANGSFESGRYWPHKWDPIDNLGTFWVEGGTTGKRCVRCYTDVDDKQWVKWNDEVILLVREATERTRGRPQSLPENPVPDPPEREPTADPKWNTVAGMHGIHYRSAFIPLKPGAIYRFSVDARGPGGTPKVFIKGFIDQTRETTEGTVVLKRNAYRAPITLHGIGDEWRRFARVFHPARSKSTYKGKAIQPQYLRVELYAYWPPGDYFFDNVRLDIVGYEEIVNPPGEEPEEKRRETIPPKRVDDGFPVF